MGHSVTQNNWNSHAKDHLWVKSNSCGDIQCKAESAYNITVNDTFYAPDQPENLFSPKITKAGPEVKFAGEHALIMNGKTRLNIDYLRGNLYEIEFLIIKSEAFMSNNDDALL